MTEVRESERPLAHTPDLEALLQALRRALARQVYAYGLGTVLGVATLWLVFAFLADWGLRVPHAVRIFHGLLFFVWIGVFAWRDLLRPLRALPDRAGLALLLERAHPELAELLISAVQFQRPGAQIDGDRALVSAVVAAAEARAKSLSPRAVLDPEAPRARLLLGGGGVACLALFSWLNPLHARTFLERLLGASTAWPQRTNLVLELPGLDSRAIVERTRERWRLRLARGTDVALLVTAEGEVPDEVRLHFDSGPDQVLNPSGGSVFRTMLQSCQENLAFHMTGGDDEDGLPRVEIEVLQPPDVEGLVILVQPPAYAGLPERAVANQDVEVLEGSHVAVHVLPAPRSARGKVRFLPDDTLQELVPMPFPHYAAAADPPPANGDAPGPVSEAGLGFELEAQKTVGFRIELVDENGLANPDPGLFRIRVNEDRAPELAVLAPARSEVDTVRGATLPLRVRAEDDFGLAALGWRVRAGGGDAAALLSGELELVRGAAQPAKGMRDIAGGGARLEIDALGGGAGPPPVDSRFELEFYARDRHAGTANEGRSAPIRLRIVTPEELLRRLQDRLAQARMDALKLSETQREKRTRIEDLLEALDGDGTLATGESLALSAALAGERRVLSDAQSLARSLASAAEDVLYARLDDKAAGLLEFYDARAAQSLDARFRAEPWRALAAESASGKLPAEGFAASLVGLVGLALEISEDHATASVTALDAAEDASGAAAVSGQLEAASAHATKVLERTEVLLSKLAEWDNFQNVLTLARDILNRQKALRERTLKLGAEK